MGCEGEREIRDGKSILKSSDAPLSSQRGHRVRRAAACSGGLTSHWRSEGERHIQKRG